MDLRLYGIAEEILNLCFTGSCEVYANFAEILSEHISYKELFAFRQRKKEKGKKKKRKLILFCHVAHSAANSQALFIYVF